MLLGVAVIGVAGCGGSNERSTPELVREQLKGCVLCASRADRLNLDRVVAVDREGLARGSADDELSYEFDNYEVPAGQLAAIQRLLGRIDFRRLSRKHLPSEGESIEVTVVVDGISYALGESVFGYPPPGSDRDAYERLSRLLQRISLAASGADERQFPGIDDLRVTRRGGGGE